MRRSDPRWLIVFLANLLLWWLTGMANDYLATFSVHLYLGGLLVAYASLQVDRQQGFVALMLTGLMVDSVEPVPFGTSMLLFGVVHATLVYGRQRLPRDGAIFGTIAALFSNLFLFIALSFLLVGANPRPGEAWLRLFVDLLASQVVIIVITPWFLALQSRAMEFAQIHPETGRRLTL